EYYQQRYQNRQIKWLEKKAEDLGLTITLAPVSIAKWVSEERTSNERIGSPGEFRTYNPSVNGKESAGDKLLNLKSGCSNAQPQQIRYLELVASADTQESPHPSQAI